MSTRAVVFVVVSSLACSALAADQPGQLASDSDPRVTYEFGGHVGQRANTNVDGWLVPPRDQDALVASILGLSADIETRKRIGAAARHKICTEYASSIELASNLAIYAKLVEY